VKLLLSKILLERFSLMSRRCQRFAQCQPPLAVGTHIRDPALVGRPDIIVLPLDFSYDLVLKPLRRITVRFTTFPMILRMKPSVVCFIFRHTPRQWHNPTRCSLRLQRTRSKRAVSTYNFVVLLLLICSCFGRLGAQADWIDPATPLDKRTTIALNVKPPPPQQATSSSDTTKQGGHRSASASPTMAPTTKTQPPSRSPTAPPSTYPTYDPSRVYELVFSDEFNVPNREFYDGADPRWTAMDKNDYTNDALHYYSPNNVRTNEHGELVITSQAADTDVVGFDDVNLKRTHVRKHFTSAMLQSWNKFCITGGILEAKVRLPGQPDVGGLWPAFWLLGNLARHTYVGSSEHIWPFASTNCSEKSARQQKISGCNKVSHYGMESYLGRGSPEIDIFEVQPGNIKANNGPFLKSPVGQPFMSASYQVAPGRAVNRPGSGEWPGPGQWYKGLTGGANSSLNILFYGTYNHFRDDVDPAKEDYWSDALSYNRQLNDSHFKDSHVYRLEWDVPSNVSHGYLHWFLDGELVYAIDGKGVVDADTGAEISSEPSYIILNTAISKQWGFPNQCPTNCPCKVYNCNSKRWQDICGFSMGFCKMMQTQPEFKIDWVRVYQDPNDPKQKVGCSTPERPSRKYILAHEKVYKTETDDHPLKGVATGLGSCDPHAIGLTPLACGGSGHGRCTPGHVCECDQGWTGPHCLANVAFDAIEYDVADRIADVGFIPPRVAPFTLWGSLFFMSALLLIGMACRRRLAIWEPVPDVGEEYLAAAKKFYYFHRRGLSV
jgi:beta-glucan synthesis-associated protein KRE6